MNVERGPDDIEELVFHHSEKLGALERQLYGHVLDAIDLDALYSLEEQVCQLMVRDKMPFELALDLSRQVIDTALRRVINDPNRFVNFGAPEGISDAERAAVAFDDACPFCFEARRSAQATALAEPAHDEEPCPCCDMVAESWREKHAEVLAKAGLATREPEGAAASAIGGAVAVAKRARARRPEPS